MNIKDGFLLCAAVVFMFTWFLRAKPNNTSRPIEYNIVAFDIYGNIDVIDGIRIRFEMFDVAWSFMKQYKEQYPLWNFALTGTFQNDTKDTIFKYI